jgi:hypothetical protein
MEIFLHSVYNKQRFVGEGGSFLPKTAWSHL